MRRLLLHLLHQPGALDDVGEAGIVFHVGGDGELAAGLDALDQDRLQRRARGVNSGGVPSRTGTDDDDLGMTSPTDFIEVVSVGEAPGNFSNAKRGILVTT